MLDVIKDGEIIRQVSAGGRLDLPDEGVVVMPAEAGWSHGDYSLVPSQPPEPPTPTPEEIRTAMPSLTARQLRLGLVVGGFSLSQVENAIAAIPDEQQRAVAEIEWEYASQFERMHPLIGQVGGAFGLTPEQIDAMWAAALGL